MSILTDLASKVASTISKRIINDAKKNNEQHANNQQTNNQQTNNQQTKTIDDKGITTITKKIDYNSINQNISTPYLEQAQETIDKSQKNEKKQEGIGKQILTSAMNWFNNLVYNRDEVLDNAIAITNDIAILNQRIDNTKNEYEKNNYKEQIKFLEGELDETLKGNRRSSGEFWDKMMDKAYKNINKLNGMGNGDYLMKPQDFYYYVRSKQNPDIYPNMFDSDYEKKIKKMEDDYKKLEKEAGRKFDFKDAGIVGAIHNAVEQEKGGGVKLDDSDSNREMLSYSIFKNDFLTDVYDREDVVPYDFYLTVNNDRGSKLVMKEDISSILEKIIDEGDINASIYNNYLYIKKYEDLLNNDDKYLQYLARFDKQLRNNYFSAIKNLENLKEQVGFIYNNLGKYDGNMGLIQEAYYDKYGERMFETADGSNTITSDINRRINAPFSQEDFAIEALNLLRMRKNANKAGSTDNLFKAGRNMGKALFNTAGYLFNGLIVNQAQNAFSGLLTYFETVGEKLRGEKGKEGMSISEIYDDIKKRNQGMLSTEVIKHEITGDDSFTSKFMRYVNPVADALPDIGANLAMTKLVFKGMSIKGADMRSILTNPENVIKINQYNKGLTNLNASQLLRLKVAEMASRGVMANTIQSALTQSQFSEDYTSIDFALDSVFTILDLGLIYKEYKATRPIAEQMFRNKFWDSAAQRVLGISDNQRSTVLTVEQKSQVADTVRLLFSEGLEQAAVKEGISVEELLEKLKKQYDDIKAGGGTAEFESKVNDLINEADQIRLVKTTALDYDAYKNGNLNSLKKSLAKKGYPKSIIDKIEVRQIEGINGESVYVMGWKESLTNDEKMFIDGFLLDKDQIANLDNIYVEIKEDGLNINEQNILREANEDTLDIINIGGREMSENQYRLFNLRIQKKAESLVDKYIQKEYREYFYMREYDNYGKGFLYGDWGYSFAAKENPLLEFNKRLSEFEKQASTYKTKINKEADSSLTRFSDYTLADSYHASNATQGKANLVGIDYVDAKKITEGMGNLDENFFVAINKSNLSIEQKNASLRASLNGKVKNDVVIMANPNHVYGSLVEQKFYLGNGGQAYIDGIDTGQYIVLPYKEKKGGAMIRVNVYKDDHFDGYLYFYVEDGSISHAYGFTQDASDKLIENGKLSPGKTKIKFIKKEDSTSIIGSRLRNNEKGINIFEEYWDTVDGNVVYIGKNTDNPVYTKQGVKKTMVSDISNVLLRNDKYTYGTFRVENSVYEEFGNTGYEQVCNILGKQIPINYYVSIKKLVNEGVISGEDGARRLIIMSLCDIDESTLTINLKKGSRLYGDIELFALKGEGLMLLPTGTLDTNGLEIYHYKRLDNGLYEIRKGNKEGDVVGKMGVNKENGRVIFVFNDKPITFDEIKIIKDGDNVEKYINNIGDDAVAYDIINKNSVNPVSKKKYTELEYGVQYMKGSITDYPGKYSKDINTTHDGLAEGLSNLKEMIINGANPNVAFEEFVDKYLLRYVLMFPSANTIQKAFDVIDKKEKEGKKIFQKFRERNPRVVIGGINLSRSDIRKSGLSFNYVKDSKTLVIGINDAGVESKRRYISIPQIDLELDFDGSIILRPEYKTKTEIIETNDNGFIRKPKDPGVIYIVQEDNTAETFKVEKTSIINPMLISAENYNAIYSDIYYDAHTYRTMLLYKPYFNVSLSSQISPEEVLIKMVNIAKSDNLLQKIMGDKLSTASNEDILKNYVKVYEVKRDIILPMHKSTGIKTKDLEKIFYMAYSNAHLPEELSFIGYFEKLNKETVKYRMNDIIKILSGQGNKLNASSYSGMALRVEALRYQEFIDQYNKGVFSEGLDLNTIDGFNEYYKRITAAYEYINEPIGINEIRNARTRAINNNALKVQAKRFAGMSYNELKNEIKGYTKIVLASDSINKALNKIKPMLEGKTTKKYDLSTAEHNALFTLMGSKLTEDDILLFISTLGKANSDKISDVLYQGINFVSSPQELFMKLSILQENILLGGSYHALGEIGKLKTEVWKMRKELGKAENQRAITKEEIIENREIIEDIKEEAKYEEEVIEDGEVIEDIVVEQKPAWKGGRKKKEVKEEVVEEKEEIKKRFDNYVSGSKYINVSKDVIKGGNDSIYTFVNDVFNLINLRILDESKQITLNKDYVSDIIINNTLSFIKTDLGQILILNALQKGLPLPTKIIEAMLNYLYGMSFGSRLDYDLSPEELYHSYGLDSKKLLNDYAELSKKNSSSIIIEYPEGFFVKNGEVPKFEYQETSLLGKSSKGKIDISTKQEKINDNNLKFKDTYNLKFDSNISNNKLSYSNYKKNAFKKGAIINKYNSILSAKEFDYLSGTKYGDYIKILKEGANEYLQIPIASKYIGTNQTLENAKIKNEDIGYFMQGLYDTMRGDIDSASLYYKSSIRNIDSGNNPIAVILTKNELKDPVKALDKIFKNNPNFNQIIVRGGNGIDNLNAMKKIIDDGKYSIKGSHLETRDGLSQIKWTSGSQNEYIINKPETLIDKETGKEVDFEKMLDKKYDIDGCNSLSL